MTLEWQPSFERHVNRNMELFVLKFVWLFFFFGSLFFLSILILISYNFGAMEVIDKISKMVDP